MVVDENVPIVANDSTRLANGLSAQAPQASDVCRLAAVRFLRELVANGRVVIDEGGECLSKYRKYLRSSGMPGTGDFFLRHLLDNGYNPERVQRISLTGSNGEYAEFPATEGLADFDTDDRLFVALAAARDPKAEIANCVDSDYKNHRKGLLSAGIVVRELCA